MQTPYDTQLKKKLTHKLFFSVFAVFSIYSFLLVPLNIKVNTDINFMIPILSYVMPLLTYLTDVAGLIILYGFIVFAAYRFGTGTVRLYSMMFVVFVFYEYLTSMLMVYAVGGYFPDFSDLLFDLMYIVAVPALYVYLTFAVVLFILFKIFSKVRSFIKAKEALVGKLPNYTFDEKALFFPFKKLFSRDNPLQLSAFWISLVFTLNKIIELIITDIKIGLPEDKLDLFMMLAAYISSFMLGFAVYIFILFILLQLNNRDIKMKYES